MDERTAVSRAREFIKQSGVASAPVDVQPLLRAFNARLIVDQDLPKGQSGFVAKLGDTFLITVNGKDSISRQRFTVLHELGHLVLDLPSSHESSPENAGPFSYCSRPPEEVFCDVFAAECLLPASILRLDVETVEPSMESIIELADKYGASITSTGSRFVQTSEEPCAFVLSEANRISYVSSSLAFRELGGFVRLRAAIPRDSSAHLSGEHSGVRTLNSEPATWLNNFSRSGYLLVEQSLPLREWNQVLTFLRLEQSDDLDDAHCDIDGDEPLLRPLDGHLPWPGRSRRR